VLSPLVRHQLLAACQPLSLSTQFLASEAQYRIRLDHEAAILWRKRRFHCSQHKAGRSVAKYRGEAYSTAPRPHCACTLPIKRRQKGSREDISYPPTFTFIHTTVGARLNEPRHIAYDGAHQQLRHQTQHDNAARLQQAMLLAFVRRRLPDARPRGGGRRQRRECDHVVSHTIDSNFKRCVICSANKRVEERLTRTKIHRGTNRRRLSRSRSPSSMPDPLTTSRRFQPTPRGPRSSRVRSAAASSSQRMRRQVGPT